MNVLPIIAAVMMSFAAQVAVAAAARPLSKEEAEIANRLDVAVRQKNSVEAFASLPWKLKATVEDISFLDGVKYCSAPLIGFEKGTIEISWQDAVDADHDCGSPWAKIKIRRGRIQWVKFGTSELPMVNAQRQTHG